MRYDVIKHFKPSELLHSDTALRNRIRNYPRDWRSFIAIFYLGFYLENLRAQYGKAIVINSGYRSPDVNTAVGGVRNSKHLDGLAVDIAISHITDYVNHNHIK